MCCGICCVALRFAWLGLHVLLFGCQAQHVMHICYCIFTKRWQGPHFVTSGFAAIAVAIAF